MGRALRVRGMEITTGVDRRSLAAAGVTVVLWASAFVAIRSAGERFSPGALTLGRLLTGAVILVVILVVRREGGAEKGAWPGIGGARGGWGHPLKNSVEQ